MATYNVYKIQYTISMADPDMPQPRYHNVIFVQTETGVNAKGQIHHVTGDITSGMSYAVKEGKQPESSATFFSRESLGTVKVADYPHEMNKVLANQPPPPKQKHFNQKTMRTEQMKPDGTFYEPGEERPPMIKCTEWTVNQAIPALYASGVLTK